MFSKNVNLVTLGYKTGDKNTCDCAPGLAWNIIVKKCRRRTRYLVTAECWHNDTMSRQRSSEVTSLDRPGPILGYHCLCFGRRLLIDTLHSVLSWPE